MPIKQTTTLKIEFHVSYNTLTDLLWFDYNILFIVLQNNYHYLLYFITKIIKL